MPVKPDIEGFADAQVRLRENFGVPVTFQFASGVEWPPGTALDPETGKPYDPTVLPTGSGLVEQTIERVSMVHRPLAGSRPRGWEAVTEEIATAVGFFEDGGAALILGREQFEDNGVADAQWCKAQDEDWEIRDYVSDRLAAGGPIRYIVFLRKR